jgi:uncharacterized protein (TIRG00374 family)
VNRRHLIAFVKLLVIAGLMVLVFSSVQWSDTHLHRTADGQERSRVGEIIGAWDRPAVEFVYSGETEPHTIEPKERADGSADVVSPGFGTYLRNLDVALFVAGALCYFVSVVFSGFRWWWLLRANDLRVTWWEAQRFTWIGLFFNNVVPGQTGGDVVKALYIMKHCPGGRLPALMSVLVDRILGLGSLALLGAVVVLFALDHEGFDTLALGVWAVLAGVAAVGVLAFSKRVRRAVRLDELLNKLPARLSGALRRVDTALHFYRGYKKGIALWMLAGMVNHAVSVTAVMWVGEALNIGMPALEYFVLVPVINIASAVPIGPNGWGVGEVAFRVLFGKYGAAYMSGVSAENARFIMGTRGVALSVLWRVHLTLWSLLGGVLVLFERERVTRRDIEQEVALEAEEVRPQSGGDGGENAAPVARPARDRG